MNKFYVVLGVVAVAGAVVVALALRGGGGTPVSEPVDLGQIADAELLEKAQPAVYGQPDAPITIMEFGDYQCPTCGYFGLSVKPQLDMAYIQEGHAKLEFHDFPLAQHPHAFLAARAVRCAGDQDRYFEYHDQIFRTQPDWSRMTSAAGHFKELAEGLGLDSRGFDACLDSDMHAELVTANLMLGQRLGVTGTPTVFVHDGQNSRRLMSFEFAAIQTAVEALRSANQ